ncbi:TetR family transcriptional regulator [Rhizobium sp. RHZ01]|uniref:TetR family transcriptional regulator n=1 Tax=Rhizobium sp. RHZ01 TaxID=2769304 RepID=UPI00177BEDF9|nr:TetR family transcriptional regulator [Rhizobium sp. RHZ01]MBD9446389.1 TetR family transcriptional regulator [Rhizobium sp. RHZ01]
MVKRNPERTKETILDAATGEFTCYGLGGARIDAIAERAGSNKRMIYHYFGDKEGLYFAVLDHAFAKMLAAERALEIDYTQPLFGIAEITRFTWQYFLANPEMVSLLGTENLNHGRFLAKSANGKLVNHHLLEKLQNLADRGIEEGSVRSGLDALKIFMTVASMSFFYLSNRFTLSTIFDRDFERKESLARWEDHIVHVVLKSTAPQLSEASSSA